MLESGSAQFKIIPRCNSKELYHYLGQTLGNSKFGNAVIHVRTNVINNSSKSLQLLENTEKNAEKCFSHGIENVFISRAVYNKKSNRYFLEQANAQVASFYREINYGIIDHSSINSSDFYYDGLHLLESGKITVVNNIIDCLDTLSPQLPQLRKQQWFLL